MNKVIGIITAIMAVIGAAFVGILIFERSQRDTRAMNEDDDYDESSKDSLSDYKQSLADLAETLEECSHIDT